MKFLLAILILFISSFAFAQSQSNFDKKIGEVRGIWINSDAMPKTNDEAIKLVDQYYNAGLNTLFPEIVCRGYAVYDSKILERDPRFVGKDDVLSTIITRAHSYGMEVHPWVWVFRAGYSKDKGAIIKNHPEWLEKSKYGDTLSVNGGMWISPVMQEPRDFLISLYKEIITNYDVDGLHLDYIRYENQNPVLYGYSDKAREKFKMQNGVDPLNIDYLSPEYIKWIEFREKHVSSFVKDVHDMVKATKPNIILSAAVANNPDEAQIYYMQNWVNWADNNWIDLIIPMTYTPNDVIFLGLIFRQLSKIDNKVYTTIGIGSHNFTKDEGKNIDQIDIARSTSYMGQSLFAASYFTPTLGYLLKTKAYNEPANLPFRMNSEKSKKIEEYKKSIKRLIPSQNISDMFPKNLLPIPEYKIAKKKTNIVIDGNVTESEWASYDKTTIKYDNLGKEVPYTTDVKATWDNDGIIISYICKEPNMDKIKANTNTRDGYTFYDDSVEVFINMVPNTIKYNHFSLNTLNTHFDQQIYNVGWNKDWESGVQKQDSSWSAEIKIPFSELSVPTPKVGEKWKMNFTRNRWVTGSVEYLNWSTTYGSFHCPERFGYVTFIE